MIQFYNKYIPRINLILCPLFTLTASRKKSEHINWTAELKQAFNKAKEALASATMLRHPRLNAPTALTTDASDLGMGAVLEQFVDHRWVPLAFFSKKFSPAQSNYSAFDRELVAIHLAIRHFKYFLEGRQFTVYTDHKPITLAICKKAESATPMQGRWLSAISSYTTDIPHVALKLPEFYTNNPEVWFSYSNAQFLLRKITADETKFAHVIIALPPHVAEQVQQVIHNPPQTNKYGTLKNLLLKRFSLSETERASLLLDLPGLGDRKPSVLLAYMQKLCQGEHDFNSCLLARELFMRQLPHDVRNLLADKQNLPLEKLAEEADRFFSTAGSRICGVRTKTASAPPTTLCFYHEKYKEKARRCRAPCSYVPEN